MTRRTFINVWSPQLRNRRNVDVYLPPSYSGGRARYPVVYMQDGQNLSDPEIAFGGTTWGVDAAVEALAARGLEAIVVGVHHAGEERIAEYSPFVDRRHEGGRADDYVAFLIDTVKPRIDRLFRTRPDRESTAILGSSMGGLVSLYAFWRYGTVFGRAGVMSPSLWFGQGRIFDVVDRTRAPRGRAYLDIGTQEGAAALRDVRRLGRLLVRKGFRRRRRSGGDRLLRYVEDAGGRHGEAYWARRLPSALEFLLGAAT